MTAIPHVLTALVEVFKTLSVDKNGILPSNMGKGAYMTAEDINAAVRGEFAKNNLLVFSNEVETKHETITYKERLNFATSITGTYTIVSAVDGSERTISGVGHGLATGTAVAANIASTFALKNALLRTFLVAEQSVENAAMEGDNAPSRQTAKPAGSRTERQVSNSTKNSSAAESKARAAVKKEFIDEGLVTPEDANKQVGELKKNGSLTPYTDLLKQFRSGDLG